MLIQQTRLPMTFTSELLVSGRKDLLTDEDISNLSKICKDIGKKDDIIEVNFSSDVFDFSEVNDKNRPTKFLSGYKLQINSTIDDYLNKDASVAKTQQNFYYGIEQYKPYTVIKNILNRIKHSADCNEYLSTVNDNPKLYNLKNNKWFPNSMLEVEEKPIRPLTRHIFNSPVNKAILNRNNPNKITVLIIDVFQKNGLTLGDSQKRDLPHGSLVAAQLEELTKNLDIDIKTMNVKAMKERPCSFNPKSLLKALKSINEENVPNYLNLSVYYPSDYLLDGKNIRPDDLYKYSEHFRAKLPIQIQHILDEIERIINLGCEVYIAGGNNQYKFNTLSLAKNAHVIGGADRSDLNLLSKNSIIEQYAPLPLYIKGNKHACTDGCVIRYPFERDLAKLSKFELKYRIADKTDYTKLKQVVDDLTQNGKYKIDLNFLTYKYAFSFNENMRGKIFDINKFLEIMQKYFDKEVIENIHPQGTHCDIQFVQFFDMNRKTKCVIAQNETSRILKSISGTSFAAPQALAQNLEYYILSKDFIKCLSRDSLAFLYKMCNIK